MMTNDRLSFSRASAKAFGSRLTHPALVPATLSWVMGCRPEPRIGRYPGRRPGRNACCSTPPRPATFGTAVRLAEVDAAHQPSRIDDDDLQHQNGTPTTRSHAASGRTPFASMCTVALSSLKQCAKTYEIRHTPTPVRVTEALQAAVLEGVARPARARAGLLLAWDLKYRSRPHHNRRGAAPGGHPEGWRAYARANPIYRISEGKGLITCLALFAVNV